MPESHSPSNRPSTRHQRKLRNYLLDAKFQLKYSTYVAVVALVIGVAAGALLWQTSEETIAHSQASVELGAEVLEESKKVSEVVAMNIVKDPVYSENPALKAAFEADAKRQTERQRDQQAELEAQASRLEAQRARVAAMLVGILVVLVLGLWLAGIVVTHKVAGPIFKMKRQMRALGGGDFGVPSPLRHGDELTEFFSTFDDMVRALRDRRQLELDQLSRSIDGLREVASEQHLKALEELRAQLDETLHK
jgi:nitrogen fixation/metabolism regulation signal transduction histidine kinase